MKYLVPLVCSLLLVGCSDKPSTEAPVEASTVLSSAPASEEVNMSQNSAEETMPAAQQTVETKIPEPSAVVQTETAAAEAPAAPAVDGAKVFAQKCASCHGTKGEKPALGKSQIIAGWNPQQTKDALHGYQAGTYGKEMKAVMAAQAKGLNDAQIDALAKHVSTF